MVANDTVAGGYAELCCGAGVAARHFFYSNIGSGIGGALFLDRVPYDGLGIGGGVANLGEVLLDPIRRHTDERVFISAQGAYRIVPCASMDAAVPVGAALLARDRCAAGVS